MNPDQEFREAAMKVIKQYEELMDYKNQAIIRLEEEIRLLKEVN